MPTDTLHDTPPVTGTTRVFLVLGDPVAQVQAPQLFNPIFRRHGVDAVLVPAQVPPARLTDFVRGVTAAGNIDGLWVTIPHKPALAALVDRCDAAATIAGSVNAVRRDADGALAGALFDGLGFVDALRHAGVAPQGRRVLLLGAGGAGAAIALALLDAGVAALAVHDLGERGRQLAERLASGHRTQVAAAASADPRGFDLVVNATPLGLRADDPLPFDVDRLEAGTTVVDILMKPQGTPLLRACAARGIAAHDGFEMLVRQVPHYLAFFGLHDAARAVRDEFPRLRASMGAR